ncbi:MAG TPA: response regulator [Thermoanaerobaculia bacterium]|jgi:CheY-like chemotaxis protein|nr:response regulator [Thermoanaerobaculia bacterium]
MHRKALVVEDEAVTRILLEQLLRSLDCDVDLAVDGEEALDWLRSHSYDVILLDIILPKMSGIDVMEALRRDQASTLDCIIVVTGLDVREIRSLFPAVHETLSKPVQPSRLREAVRSCLIGPRRSDASPFDERITPG